MAGDGIARPLPAGAVSPEQWLEQTAGEAASESHKPSVQPAAVAAGAGPQRTRKQQRISKHRKNSQAAGMGREPAQQAEALRRSEAAAAALLLEEEIASNQKQIAQLQKQRKAEAWKAKAAKKTAQMCVALRVSHFSKAVGTRGARASPAGCT